MQWTSRAGPGCADGWDLQLDHGRNSTDLLRRAREE